MSSLCREEAVKLTLARILTARGPAEEAKKALVPLGPSQGGRQRPPQQRVRGTAGAGQGALVVESKMKSSAGMGRIHLPALETLRRWWQQKRLLGGNRR